MSKFALIWGLLLVICCFCPPAEAHELRPGYLQLRESGKESYDVLWKVPGRGENLRLSLYVQFPESCSHLSQPRGKFADNAFVENWSMRCAGGLAGHRIHIIGLAATMTDVLARLERLDGSAQVVRLMPSEPSFVVEAAPSGVQVALTYLKLGVEHILTGIDHLLFVLALIIITPGGWRLVKTVSAFTVSHSITLTAAALGFVNIPQRPVEVIIALSIVFVAVEIVKQKVRFGVRDAGCELRDASLTVRKPWIVAFTFGLLHGLGFAGGLSEVGLPAGHIPTALLFFSAGVETGHLLFVAAVLGLLLVARVGMKKIRDTRYGLQETRDEIRDTGYGIRDEEPASRLPYLTSRVSNPASRIPHPVSRIPNLESGIVLFSAYAIGSVAMFWVIQRIAAF